MGEPLEIVLLLPQLHRCGLNVWRVAAGVAICHYRSPKRRKERRHMLVKLSLQWEPTASVVSEEVGVFPEEQCRLRRRQRSTPDIMCVVRRLQELGQASNVR